MATTHQFVERARAKHGDRFDYSRTRYTGFTEPVDVACPEHGVFQTTPKSHLAGKSGGCLLCHEGLIREALRLTTDEFKERACNVHGNRYDYSQAHYEGGRSRVTIVCPTHGPFRMRAHRHLEGRGCRKCAFCRIGLERRLSFWDFVERVTQVHGARQYEYELADFENLRSKIPIRCPLHGVFRQSVANHLKGHGCPGCVQSAGEKRVREALTAIGVEFEKEHSFSGCRDRYPLRFDFYVPKHRLLIEFDGRQHYEMSELWGGHENLSETQRRDAMKDRFAASHGYRLLRIPFSEIDNVENLVLDVLASTEGSHLLN